MEAIVLVGGLGTRVQSVLPHLQKCMAPVLGKPFLAHLVEHLTQKGVDRFILATGYQHAQVEKWVQEQPNPEQFVISVESNPLGTGGAMLQALKYCRTEHILLLNGDSYIQFDYPSLLSAHLSKQAGITLVATSVSEGHRYGAVTRNDQQQVTEWKEKGASGPSLINAGVYLVAKSVLIGQTIAPASLEKDIIPALLAAQKVYAVLTPGPLLDIGTPESLMQAAAIMQTIGPR
jgi:D-glycero-alpha-D-manno-heptose 1-phosphate guanylyltransferase